MTRSITIFIIIFIFTFSILLVNTGASQDLDNSSILYLKKICYKNDENLTGYRIETDFDNNYIVIYGNETQDDDWRPFGPDLVNISKFDAEGNLIWDKYLKDNFWSFGIHDLQIDTENNIHLILWRRGWCGNEAPSFEYYKLSPDGETLLNTYFTGTFTQMRIYNDNSVGILYFYPYNQFWSNNEDKSENHTGEIWFTKITNGLESSVGLSSTFIPRCFLIENDDHIILISNSSWRLSMSAALTFISDLSNELSVSGTVTAKGSYFIFKENYDIKLLKISNDYKSLEIYKIILDYGYYSENKTSVKFDNDGKISLLEYYNGNITKTIIDPINDTTKSNLINLHGKRLIDSTYGSDNSMVLLLSDGYSDEYGIEIAKNIFLGSQTVNFKDDYLDSDNDGYEDWVEYAEGTDPFDPNSTPSDMDSDNIPDSLDPDIDGDEVPNEDDEYPYDRSKWEKTEEIDNLVIFYLLTGVIVIIILIGTFFKVVKNKNK